MSSLSINTLIPQISPISWVILTLIITLTLIIQNSLLNIMPQEGTNKYTPAHNINNAWNW